MVLIRKISFSIFKLFKSDQEVETNIGNDLWFIGKYYEIKKWKWKWNYK